MLKKAYLKSWFTDAWSGRLDSRHLDGWTLDNWASMLNFPDASSDKILHCLNVHLVDRQINTAVIYVGSNDYSKRWQPV